MTPFPLRPLHILLLGTSLALLGCEPTTRNISFSVESAYPTKLKEVTIEIGHHHRFEVGNLIPNAHKGYLGPVTMEKINPSTLTWTTDDGQTQSATFSVTREELTHDRGVKFIIHPDHSITKDHDLDEGF